MFSPMERLKEAGKSLSDLEHNGAVQPPWRNRKSILGAVVNIALAITVGRITP
jgi:peptide subunit release factor RF-3